MSQEPDELNASLRALAEEENRKLDAHPSTEELVAYHEGKPPAEEQERLQDHLAVCKICVELLLDLEAFPELKAGEHELGNTEMSKAWGRMKTRLPEDEKGQMTPKIQGQRLSGLVSSTRIPYALAASLVLLGLVFGSWIASLRQENRRLGERLNEQSDLRDRDRGAISESLKEAQRQLEDTTRRIHESEAQIAALRQTVDQLSQPQPNVAIADLYPRGYQRGRGDGVARIDVPARTTLLTLILNVTDQRTYPSYDLEISDQRGKQIWQGKGLQKSPLNNFSVALPRSSFPAGRYRIKLYGLRGGQREVVEDYSLQIRYQ